MYNAEAYQAALCNEHISGLNTPVSGLNTPVTAKHSLLCAQFR